MQEISSGIREALLEQGIEQLRIETRLSPAWTADWMSAKGREALQGYGIAPPGEKAIDISGITRRPSDVVGPCPLRSEEHTSELQSLMRNSYAVFCLKKKRNTLHNTQHRSHSTS